MQHSSRSDAVTPSAVVDRISLLLGAFGPADDVVALAELSRRTGLPKPTVHRLVRQLAAHNLVEILPDGLRIGMGLFELGQRAGRQRGLRDAASRHAARLYDTAGATVHVAVASGGEVVYVEKIEHGRSPAVASRVGGRMPAHCTALGKALLAHATSEDLLSVLRGELTRRTPRTQVAPGLLRRELVRVRETGIAREHEESTPGVTCIAAPILDERGSAVAAVSVTGWAHRVDLRAIVPAVRTTAHDIARSLQRSGYPAASTS